MLNHQRRTDPSGSAIKTLAATSCGRRMNVSCTKKPHPLGNLQNNHILTAKSTVTRENARSQKLVEI